MRLTFGATASLRLPVLAVLLALGALAQPILAEDAAADPEPSVLEDPDWGLEPVEPQRCIDARRIQRVEVIRSHSLLFWMRGSQVWRMPIRDRCPSLRDGDAFSWTLRGRNLCRGDLVHAMHRYGSRGLQRGPGCMIPGFEAMTEDQALALREYL